MQKWRLLVQILSDKMPRFEVCFLTVHAALCLTAKASNGNKTYCKRHFVK